jgi:predicted RNA binding protein YcfA (HicA-like mRNA interferase family)
MSRFPVIPGKEFIRFLETQGFSVSRINGSHHRMKHPDGRLTTIPVHRNIDLPKGLLRKIIREDIKIQMEEFNKLWVQFKKLRKGSH